MSDFLPFTSNIATKLRLEANRVRLCTVQCAGNYKLFLALVQMQMLAFSFLQFYITQKQQKKRLLKSRTVVAINRHRWSQNLRTN